MEIRHAHYFEALLPGFDKIPFQTITQEKIQHLSYCWIFIHQFESNQPENNKMNPAQLSIPNSLGPEATLILQKIIELLLKPIDLTINLKVLHLEVSAFMSLSELLNLLSKTMDLSKTIFFPLGTQSTRIFTDVNQALHLIHSTIQTTTCNTFAQLPIKYIPLFHPEMMHINPSLKRPSWDMLKQTIPLLTALVSQEDQP